MDINTSKQAKFRFSKIKINIVNTANHITNRIMLHLNKKIRNSSIMGDMDLTLLGNFSLPAKCEIVF